MAPQTSFEVAWPSLSSQPDGFSSLPGLKDLEARMLKAAREKALKIEKEAYEKGFEQGERDGRELGLKRLEVVLHQMHQVLFEIMRQKREFQQAYEKEMLKLALNLGKRIFRQMGLLYEEAIIAVLRDAFQYVMDRENVCVRLHPADYQYLLSHPDKAPFPLDEKEGIRLIADPSITRGGCLIDTSFGEVDATFESQFDEMISLIWKKHQEMEHRPHP